jgi:hypothetical protein
LFVCLLVGTPTKAAVSSRFLEPVGGLGATPVGIANLDVVEMMGVVRLPTMPVNALDPLAVHSAIRLPVPPSPVHWQVAKKRREDYKK